METLPFEIAETAHSLRKAFDRMAVGLGVTRAQWKVLFKLTRIPGLRQVELADMLELEPITLCRIVDRLEEAGLVERTRDPEDRRAWRLHVTAKAQPLVEKLQTVGAALVDQAFAGIDPQTLKQPGKCLRRRGRMLAGAEYEQGIESMNKMATEPMTGEAADEAPKTRRKAKLPAGKGSLRTILMLIVPAFLIIGGAYYWLTSGGSVGTDDAQVKQDIVSVSAQVTGPVQQVFVRNGQEVKRGDVIFTIDPAPFRVALENAEAELAQAELQTTQLRTQAAGTGARYHGVGRQSQDQAERPCPPDRAAQAGLHHPVRL